MSQTEYYQHHYWWLLYYMIIICPKSTLVHWQGDSLTYPIWSWCATHCATIPILFCLRFSLGSGKGKIVLEITKPAPYLSGSFGENRGVFFNREDSWKKRKKVWNFCGFFSQEPWPNDRCWCQSFFYLMKFKCVCVKCWNSNL